MYIQREGESRSTVQWWWPAVPLLLFPTGAAEMEWFGGGGGGWVVLAVAVAVVVCSCGADTRRISKILLLPAAEEEGRKQSIIPKRTKMPSPRNTCPPTSRFLSSFFLSSFDSGATNTVLAKKHTHRKFHDGQISAIYQTRYYHRPTSILPLIYYLYHPQSTASAFSRTVTNKRPSHGSLANWRTRY